RQVPRGEVGALVSQHGDALKAAGPVVEIFLICEAAVLVPVVTPLEAALAPPAQAVQRMGIASEAYPSHVVDPVQLQALQEWWEPVPDDSDGTVSQLLVDRCGIRKEKQIRVQIRDEVHARIMVQDE